jgi:hypothetical protein
MGFLFDASVAISRIKGSEAKANGLEDDFAVDIEVVMDKFRDDGLEHTAFTRVFDPGTGVEILSRDGLLAGIGPRSSRRSRLETWFKGSNAQRAGSGLSAATLLGLDHHPAVIALSVRHAERW